MTARRIPPSTRPLLEALEPRALLTATVDVMVLYTPDARISQGSTPAIQTLVARAVNDANAILANSLIDAAFRLVYSGEIAYAESGSLDTDLDRLTSSNDGHIDFVHALRATYGADLVSLLVADSDDGVIGLGWELQDLYASQNPLYGFSVLHASTADAPDYTLAHELGHNLGAGHDRATDPDGGVFSYSAGHHFIASGTEYHTVMAYEPGITVPFFSNPNVAYLGVPTGSAVHDNARTIRATAPVVAQYRPTVVGASLPVGSVAPADDGVIRGWTVDLDVPHTPLSVRIAVNGRTATTLTAELNRPDLATLYGATNHGFTYAIPNLPPGTHTLSFYALDALTGDAALLSTQTVISQNAYYSEHAYLTLYPDIAAAVNAGALPSGYAHYVARGAAEGRNPSAFFDERWYRTVNPDVQSAVLKGQLVSGLQHYQAFGAREGRDPTPYFDESFYRAAYPDVDAAVRAGVYTAAFEHFLYHGQHENRRPSPLLDLAAYAASAGPVFQPVAASAFEHLVLVGINAGASPLSLFDRTYYLAQNPDVALASNAGQITSVYDHFVRYGFRERRPFSPAFNTTRYLALNPDVAAAVNAGLVDSALAHYVLYGQRENRRLL